MRFLATAALALLAAPAFAECPADATGSVRLLSNDFPALNAVAARMMECARDGLEVTANQTTAHMELQGPALQADPAEYTVKIVANGSFSPLASEGLIRPLDDLVAQYGQGLRPNQLIRVDGQIMAIAFMANAESFFWRQDVLDQAGVEPPATWADVVAAAEAIRAAGIMENPYGQAYAPGWELGQAFVNMYLGLGGEFFEEGTANPSIANETGVAALEMMKGLVGVMGPDYLTWSSDALPPLMESNEAAMTFFWGSEASQVLPGTTIAPTVADQVRVAAAPAAVAGGPPATTVWWDGFVLAKNISDEDAAASFRVMMHALDPQLVADNPTLAVWLIEGYEPTPAAAGVIGAVEGGAPSYPMVPYMGLLHMAIDGNIADFLQGNESAEQALADAEAAYVTSATEAGFLQ